MSNPTRVSNAKELIAAVFAKYGVAKTKHRHDKYDFPYENTPALVERGLAKEYYAKEKYDEFIENSKKSKEKAEEREKQTKRRDTMAKVVKLRREKI
jgi:hypothetical protein